MRKKKKTVLSLLKKISIFVILIVSIVGLVVFVKTALVVKKIDCRFNQTACPGEIWMELMSLTIGKNIVFFPTKDLVSQIKASHPLLKEVKIKKSLPNHLSFELKKREPQAALKSPEEGFWIVDEEGFLLEKANEIELPVILVEQPINLNVGEKIEKEAVWTINLLKSLKFRLLMPKTAKIVSPRQIEIELSDGLLVIFSSLKEVNFQLDSLQLIFSRSKIEGRNLKQIDLRFDKPVVIYE
ncbi:MAG TPA: cell division protein FtsQ/DivIB [Nevskiaceae bacterium]|nr:cell division protein FtsQ/DivIB [Nevskiaceae bacterium]